MKVLGSTPEGDFIIQVSRYEWDSMGGHFRQENNGLFYNSEVYQVLKGHKLSGINWLSLKTVFDQGLIDGTVEQLKRAIESRQRYLYGTTMRQRSLDRIYAVLNDSNKATMNE